LAKVKLQILLGLKKDAIMRPMRRCVNSLGGLLVCFDELARWADAAARVLPSPLLSTSTPPLSN